MINLKKWIINDRGGLFLDEGGGWYCAQNARFFYPSPMIFTPLPKSEILDEG